MKILVAGLGNIFHGDDGFGPAVARALAIAPGWPPALAVTVTDFGIRGMDLAYALTSGVDAAILVDATARGGAPGTLYVIEPITREPSGSAEDPVRGEVSIATHGMDPARVLTFASSLGATPGYVRVVGCEPERLEDEDGDLVDGLSAPVAAAIPAAAQLVGELVRGLAEATCTS